MLGNWRTSFKIFVIEDRVGCGANVTITKGVRIGKGAVVTKDVTERSIVERYLEK